MKLLKRIIIAVLVLALIIIGGVYFYLKSGLPVYNGELKFKGLKDEVKVLLDAHAIPHIYASNEEDAYRALGYVHAQERLFQMEMIRRLASGRMAEILGSEMVDVDVFFRTMGIRRQAKKSAIRFQSKGDAPDVKAALAYLEGLNDFIDNGPPPIEFKILGIEKEHFDLTDVYSAIGYVTLGFSNVTKQEPVVTRMFQKYGKEYLKDWNIKVDFPAYDSTEKVTQMALQSVFQKVREKAAYPIQFGSNSWVISAEKSKSGKVIFTNDAHMFYAQPSNWYEAYIEYPGLKFYGNYIAGIPFGFIGHNPKIAWGLTIFPTDNMDMYFEKPNPDNPDQLWVNDHWEDVHKVEETISIKDRSDTTIIIKISRHGPLLDGLMKKDPYSDKSISLRWVYNEMQTTTLEAIYQMGRSQNIDDAREATKLIDILGLNVMYGDADDNIAWWASGKISKRPAHVNSKVILDGASGKDELIGYFDFSENPHSENPEVGYLISANNKPPAVNGYNYPGYYTPDIRAVRIKKLLDSKNKVGMEDMKKMHRDVVSDSDNETAKAFVNDLEELVETDAEKEGLDYLRDWDGDYNLESSAAVIYAKLQFYMLEYGIKDELGQDDFDALLNSYLIKRTIPDLFVNDASLWWDDVNTPEKETRIDILSKAYSKTINDLVAQLGNKLDAWKWGDVHTLTHEHPIGKKEPFDKLFNVGPFPDPGTNAVLNKQAFFMNGNGEYHAFIGPAMRIIHDFSQPDNSLSINPTGQSGHFNSPYYDDQAALYMKGEYRKQMTDKNEVINSAIGTLIFKP